MKDGGWVPSSIVYVYMALLPKIIFYLHKLQWGTYMVLEEFWSKDKFSFYWA